MVVDGGRLAQTLGEGNVAARHNHELLHLEAAAGVLAAVDDVAHRARQVVLGLAALAREAGGEELKQLLVRELGAGLGERKRRGGDRIAADDRLELGAVRLAQQLVDRAQILRVGADQRRAEQRVDIVHGGEHALAEVARRVLVADLDGLVRASGRARRRRAARNHLRDAGERRVDVDLDGRVAARVEHLARVQLLDHRRQRELARLGGQIVPRVGRTHRAQLVDDRVELLGERVLGNVVEDDLGLGVRLGSLVGHGVRWGEESALVVREGGAEKVRELNGW